MTNSNNRRKSGAELLAAVQVAVIKIGKTNGTKAPIVNDEQDAVLIEYSISKAILAAAEARERAARIAVEGCLTDQLSKVEVGNPAMIVHTSSYAGLTAQRVRGASRLNKDRTATAIAQKFELPLITARQFIEESCTTKDKDQLRLTPALILGE